MYAVSHSRYYLHLILISICIAVFIGCDGGSDNGDSDSSGDGEDTARKTTLISAGTYNSVCLMAA